MKVYYKHAGAGKDLQCYGTSNYYLEERLKKEGALVNSPNESDIIYIQENIGGLDLFKQYPDKIKVLQMVTSHPETYCKLFYEECEKYHMWDQRPLDWKPIRNAEIALADYIIVYSKFTYNSCISAGVPKSRLKIIPKGVETDFFTPKKVSKSQDVFTIGYVGQYQLIKGLQYLPIPTVGDSNMEWLFCGDKTEYIGKDGKRSWQFKKVWYKNIWDTTSLINDMGKLPKRLMPDIYSKCDLVVLPSIEDSFNMCVLEALSCDVPVVTTENTGAGELITHRKNGSIVPIRDNFALCKEIDYWMGYRPKKGECRKVALNHTMDKYMDDIIKFLKTKSK